MEQEGYLKSWSDNQIEWYEPNNLTGRILLKHKKL